MLAERLPHYVIMYGYVIGLRYLMRSAILSKNNVSRNQGLWCDPEISEEKNLFVIRD